jgi:hypothetical protein
MPPTGEQVEHISRSGVRVGLVALGHRRGVLGSTEESPWLLGSRRQQPRR